MGVELKILLQMYTCTIIIPTSQLQQYSENKSSLCVNVTDLIIKEVGIVTNVFQIL